MGMFLRKLRECIWNFGFFDRDIQLHIKQCQHKLLKIPQFLSKCNSENQCNSHHKVILYNNHETFIFISMLVFIHVSPHIPDIFQTTSHCFPVHVWKISRIPCSDCSGSYPLIQYLVPYIVFMFKKESTWHAVWLSRSTCIQNVIYPFSIWIPLNHWQCTVYMYFHEVKV